MKLNTIISVLGALGANLTGSRYFHERDPDLIKLRPDTDYDFVIGVGEFGEAEGALYKLGFQSKSSFDYTTKTGTVMVLGMVTEDGVGVDLIVKSNIAMYLRAFEQMTPEFYYCRIWKSAGVASKLEIEDNLWELL